MIPGVYFSWCSIIRKKGMGNMFGRWERVFMYCNRDRSPFSGYLENVEMHMYCIFENYKMISYISLLVREINYA